MIAFLRALSANCKGATAVEYGLIVALVIITMVVSVVSLGNASTQLWNNVNTKVAAVGVS
jgi:pilus assembly protein Flp/PilA